MRDLGSLHPIEIRDTGGGLTAPRPYYQPHYTAPTRQDFGSAASSWFVPDMGEIELAEGIWFRIRSMQFLATLSLFIMFCLNWNLNPDAFEVQSRSDFLREMHIFLIGMIGVMLGILVCVLPLIVSRIEMRWDDYVPMPYTRKRGIALLILILFLIGLWIGPIPTLTFIFESFLTFFFCAALVFGMYGIWHQRGPHIVTAAMFSFATAIGRVNTINQLSEILAFSIFFLCFIELGESSMRYNTLMIENLVPVKHQAKMLEKYYEHFLLFALLALALTYISIYGRQMADEFAGKATAEAIELHTLYGVVPPAIFIIVGLIIFRMLWNQGHIRRWFSFLAKLLGRVSGGAATRGPTPVPAPAGPGVELPRSSKRSSKKRKRR